MAGLEQARTHEIVERMLHFMQVQYAANSGVTLDQIRDDNCPPYYLNPQLLAFANGEREAMVAVLAAESEAAHSGSQPPHRSLLDAFVTSTQEYIYRNNQFITLSADDRREMTAVYIDFVDSMIEALSGALAASEVDGRMRMKAAGSAPFMPWHPHRGEGGGAVLIEVAEDGPSEAAGVVREIEQRHASGTPYREQAGGERQARREGDRDAAGPLRPRHGGHQPARLPPRTSRTPMPPLPPLFPLSPRRR